MIKRIKKKHYSIPFTSLFSRLLFNLMVVMLIPLFILIVTYLTLGSNALSNTLTQQGKNNIEIASQRMQSLIDEYRHKTYLISTDEEIEQVITKKKEQSGILFEKLFTIMSGDTYLATASAISKDGKVRLSTHLFPDQYDVRYFSNDTTPFFDVNRLRERNASIITTKYRYLTQTNSLVLLNILRAIRDEANEITGYVALDVHQEAFEEVTKGLGFSDLLIIDSDTYRVSSLIYVEKNGDFSLFPPLAPLSFPLISDSYASKGTIVSVKLIKNTNLYIAGITETSTYEQTLNQFGLIILLIIAMGTSIAFFIALYISRSIGTPVDRLVMRMKKVEKGDLSSYPPLSSIEEFHLLETSFNEMVEQISTLLVLTREEEAKVR
ncbi:MAG: HAMP domain-containing protein, partial [Spirochaetia bacterium]|nr:HAMP domain-containing protein [Spirochaetia bacterium]